MRKHSIRKWIHFDKSDIALIAILIAAGIARFWALDFGFPHTLCRPDESRIVNIAVKFGGGDLNPHFFSYPSLYPYTLFVLFGLYYVVGMILGTFSSVSDLILEFATAPSSFYLIDRIVVATLGTATVYTVYRVAPTLFTKRIAIGDLTRLYTLRHTFASRMVMQGVNLPTVMKPKVHADVQTTMIYAPLAPDHLV